MVVCTVVRYISDVTVVAMYHDDTFVCDIALRCKGHMVYMMYVQQCSPNWFGIYRHDRYSVVYGVCVEAIYHDAMLCNCDMYHADISSLDIAPRCKGHMVDMLYVRQAGIDGNAVRSAGCTVRLLSFSWAIVGDGLMVSKFGANMKF
jgi:hypothetical protein